MTRYQLVGDERRLKSVVFWNGHNFREVQDALGVTRVILARTLGEYLLNRDHLEVKTTPRGPFTRVGSRCWLLLREDDTIEVLKPHEFALRVEFDT